MVADYIHYRNEIAKHGNPKYPVRNVHTNEWHDTIWEYEKPHPTPSKLMADYYGMNEVNLAFPGSGNKQIFYKLSDYVIKNHKKIGLVVACWSSFTRVDLETNQQMLPANDYQSIVFSEYRDSERVKREVNDRYPLWKMLWNHGHMFYQKDIDAFYRYSILLDSICKQYGIECVQGASIITYPTSDDFNKYFIEHPMLSEVNHINFYGWPVFWDMGGRSIYDFNEKHFVSEHDQHPNAKGHEVVANRLIEFIDSRGFV